VNGEPILERVTLMSKASLNRNNVVNYLLKSSLSFARYRLKPNKDQRTFPNVPQQKGGNDDRNGDSFQDETICLAIDYLLKLAAENLDQHDSEHPTKTPLPKTLTSSTVNSSDL